MVKKVITRRGPGYYKRRVMRPTYSFYPGTTPRVKYQDIQNVKYVRWYDNVVTDASGNINFSLNVQNVEDLAWY